MSYSGVNYVYDLQLELPESDLNEIRQAVQPLLPENIKIARIDPITGTQGKTVIVLWHPTFGSVKYAYLDCREGSWNL